MYTITEPINPNAAITLGFAPPTIPPPPAPRKSRGLLIGALALAVLGLGATTTVLATRGTTATPPTSAASLPSTVTTPPRSTIPTVDPNASLLRWVINNSDNMIEITNGFSSRTTSMADVTSPTAMSILCADASLYAFNAKSEPTSLDADAPREWTMMLNYYQNGFHACAAGDFDTAAELLAAANGEVDTLTAMARAAMP